MNQEREDVLFTVAKKLNLENYEYEMLIHDVNNLRGNEWTEYVEETGDKELIKAFKQVITY